MKNREQGEKAETRGKSKSIALLHFETWHASPVQHHSKYLTEKTVNYTCSLLKATQCMTTAQHQECSTELLLRTEHAIWFTLNNSDKSARGQISQWDGVLYRFSKFIRVRDFFLPTQPVA